MGGVTPDRSREVPIPERSGTAFRKGPGLARPIRSVPFRLQNLGCPGLRARGSLGPTPRALSGLLAPGAGASQHAGRAATAATGLRRLFQCFSFFSEVSGDRLPVLPGLPSRPVACAGGQCRCCAGRTNQGDGWPHASTALRRWHWRSGDRSSYLSGPRRTEPRSAAERLLALKTKFLRFWEGQGQDSVLSLVTGTTL
jgi:hypothetical protein